MKSFNRVGVVTFAIAAFGAATSAIAQAPDVAHGDVTNGTPNADLIFQAFNDQGLAGTQRTKSTPVCAPPAG